VKADLAEHQSKIEKTLKKKALQFKNLSSNKTNKPHVRAYYQQLEQQQLSGQHPAQKTGQEIKVEDHTFKTQQV